MFYGHNAIQGPGCIKNLIFWPQAGVLLVPELLEIAENQMAVAISAYRK